MLEQQFKYLREVVALELPEETLSFNKSNFAVVAGWDEVVHLEFDWGAKKTKLVWPSVHPNHLVVDRNNIRDGLEKKILEANQRKQYRL